MVRDKYYHDYHYILDMADEPAENAQASLLIELQQGKTIQAQLERELKLMWEQHTAQLKQQQELLAASQKQLSGIYIIK